MSVFTKNMILEAFTELLKQKPFSKITIQDIADRCGISRMTFYYHFSDVYEMIEWAIEEKMKKAVDINFTYETWQQGYTAVFKEIRKEKTFFLNVFPSIDLRRIETYLMNVARQFIQGVINEKLCAMNITIPETTRAIVCDIYGYSMIGFLLEWISQGMKEEPETAVSRFCFVLKGTLEMTLLQAAKFNE